MNVEAVSAGTLLLVKCGGEPLGSRVNDAYDGVDAFFCSPADFMAVNTVIINVSWS